MRWLKAYGEDKLGKGPTGTFHLYAGEVSIKAILPKGALAKPLEDVLLAPFLERLQGKGKGFSLVDTAKLNSARIEVDGQTEDLSRPAASFVKSPDEPVVIIYRMEGDEAGGEAEVPAYSTTEDPLGGIALDVSNEEPLFTEATPDPSPFAPDSPFSPTLSESNSSSVLFSTTNNNRALARARAARLSRSNSSMTPGVTPQSSSGGETDNGLIDFGSSGDNVDSGKSPFDP